MKDISVYDVHTAPKLDTSKFSRNGYVSLDDIDMRDNVIYSNNELLKALRLIKQSDNFKHSHRRDFVNVIQYINDECDRSICLKLEKNQMNFAEQISEDLYTGNKVRCEGYESERLVDKVKSHYEDIKNRIVEFSKQNNLINFVCIYEQKKLSPGDRTSQKVFELILKNMVLNIDKNVCRRLFMFTIVDIRKLCDRGSSKYGIDLPSVCQIFDEKQSHYRRKIQSIIDEKYTHMTHPTVDQVIMNDLLCDQSDQLCVVCQDISDLCQNFDV